MWNYRVVRRFYPNTHMDDIMLYEIYEIYYDKDGKIRGLTEEPIKLGEETIDDLRKTVEQLTKCLEQPIIDYETLKEI
jgi:hypothetical protein